MYLVMCEYEGRIFPECILASVADFQRWKTDRIARKARLEYVFVNTRSSLVMAEMQYRTKYTLEYVRKFE